MKIQQGIRNAVLAAILGASGLSGVALAIDEVEGPDSTRSTKRNDPIRFAQPLSVAGDTSVTRDGATVYGVIGRLSGSSVRDADFYSFYGQKDDIVTIAIEGGVGGKRSVVTGLAVFGPGPDYIVKRENYNADADPRIEKFKLDVTGIHTVGVIGIPGDFYDGGKWEMPRLFVNSNGDYTLVITSEMPKVVQINIEIKPGSGEVAPLNPRSKGNIPVALLSSAEFDALAVDLKSLTFGATGNEASFRRCSQDGEDINGDGRLDRVCHFENQLAGFDMNSVEGIVKGKTGDGRLFEGRGLLKVLRAK